MRHLDAIKTICSVPMLIISLATLSALIRHAYGVNEEKTLVYWRLIIAASIMAVF
jgi:hypothetical protein